MEEYSAKVYTFRVVHTCSCCGPYLLVRHFGHHCWLQVVHWRLSSTVFWRHCSIRGFCQRIKIFQSLFSSSNTLLTAGQYLMTSGAGLATVYSASLQQPGSTFRLLAKRNTDQPTKLTCIRTPGSAFRGFFLLGSPAQVVLLKMCECPHELSHGSQNA